MAIQSSIDVALWSLADDVGRDFDHKRHTYGYLLTYVDDFLLVGPLHVRNAIEEEISRIWKIRVEGQVNQFDRKKSRSVVNLFIDGYSIAPEVRRIYNEPGSIYTRCIEELGNDKL